MSEELLDLSEGVNLINVLHLSFKERKCLFLHDVLLLGCVRIVLHTALVSQSIVHGKLLLQFLDLPFELLAEEFWVLLNVDHGLIADLHHARGEFKGGNGLLVLLWLRIDVGYHDCLAVAADGVFEEVSELALTVGDMVALVITYTDHNLLQEGQGFVDIGRLLKTNARGT